jgi:2-iminobutanoate/2-iminopropanoate deaminase
MISRTLVATLGVALAAGLFYSARAQSSRRYIAGRSAGAANAATQPPFSGAVLAGDTLYISGTLGTGDTAADAARNVLTSIKGTLEAAGMTMDDLVQVHVFATDLAYYNDFNTVYRTFFTKEYPARAFLGAGSLLNNAKFEVAAVAVKR